MIYKNYKKLHSDYSKTSIYLSQCIEDLLTVFICILRHDFDQSDNVFQEKGSVLSFLLLLLPKGGRMEDMIWLVNINTCITKHEILYAIA